MHQATYLGDFAQAWGGMKIISQTGELRPEMAFSPEFINQ
jgi:hypothetical protein